ncbi:hypothetical protein ACTS9C_04830 [Empedobacter brevis]
MGSLNLNENGTASLTMGNTTQFLENNTADFGFASGHLVMAGNYQSGTDYLKYAEYAMMGVEGTALYGEATWKNTSKLDFSKGSTISPSITTGTPFGFKTISSMSKFAKIGGPLLGAGLAAPGVYNAYQISDQAGNRQLAGASGGILGGAAMGAAFGSPTGPGAIATGIGGGIIGGFIGEKGVTKLYDWLTN